MAKNTKKNIKNIKNIKKSTKKKAPRRTKRARTKRARTRRARTRRARTKRARTKRARTKRARTRRARTKRCRTKRCRTYRGGGRDRTYITIAGYRSCGYFQEAAKVASELEHHHASRVQVRILKLPDHAAYQSWLATSLPKKRLGERATMHTSSPICWLGDTNFAAANLTYIGGCDDFLEYARRTFPAQIGGGRRRYGGNKETEWKKKFLASAAKQPALKDAIQNWGIPGSDSKSLSELYKEVTNGDSHVEFTENGPLRVINVVQMEIYPTTKQQFVLKEKKHFSPENTATPIKERDMLLSEKIQGKEAPINAAMRGIAEELGANHKVTVIMPPRFLKENTTTSWSYPHLQGAYRYFLGKAIVQGLPVPPQHLTFQTTEFNPDHSKKRIIEWAWEPHVQKIEVPASV